MTKPFTYHLFHEPTQQHYYGVRYAFGCDPSDIWTVYFSSSHIVHQLIKEYGADSFKVKVRKVFLTKEEAISWERRVLKRLDAKNRPNWINLTNASGYHESRRGAKLSDETRKRMSEAKLGRPSNRKGKTNSASSNAKRSESLKLAWKGRSHPTKGKPSWNKGIPMSDEARFKLSSRKKGQKNSSAARSVRFNGVIYPSLTEASHITGVSIYKLKKLGELV